MIEQKDSKKSKKDKLDPEMMDLINKAADSYIERMKQGEKIGLSTIVAEVMSAVMKREREIFLEHVPDEANGFYDRYLQLSIGKLGLKVPRVRFAKEFRPALLPPKWRRVDKDYENLLIAMLTNGYSQSQIERALHALNLPYSQERLEEMADMVHEKFEVYKTSSLPEEVFAVMIDAYHASMKSDGKMKDIAIFTAIGISLDGQKSILGFWIVEGKESRAFWADVFQDMIARGLKRVAIFVTDDFPGVREMIRKLFPFSDHQLCFLHMQRNIRRELPRKVYAEVKPHLYHAKESHTREEGLKHFNDACDIIEKNLGKEYASRLRDRADNYLAFLAYPEEVRKFVYTTNAVESINAGLDFMRRELGGYFPSKQSLEVNYFVQIVNMNDSWMKAANPLIRSRSYELKQIMTMKFELNEAR